MRRLLLHQTHLPPCRETLMRIKKDNRKVPFHNVYDFSFDAAGFPFAPHTHTQRYHLVPCNAVVVAGGASGRERCRRPEGIIRKRGGGRLLRVYGAPHCRPSRVATLACPGQPILAPPPVTGSGYTARHFTTRQRDIINNNLKAVFIIFFNSCALHKSTRRTTTRVCIHLQS